jgi:hypothetical protein
MRTKNPRLRRSATGRRGAFSALVLVLALGAAPACWAQAPKAPAPAAGGPSDLSAPGNARPDTKVLHPKDGETISVRLPKQGLVLVESLIPWAVTGEKKVAPELAIKFEPRGIWIQHTGGADSGIARATFTLRLIDGRTITVNVRTGNTKYKIGYAVIT